jgi:hypothetical protein
MAHINNCRITGSEIFQNEVIATDPEGEEITYTLNLSPVDMTISFDGVISWTPKALATASIPGGSNHHRCEKCKCDSVCLTMLFL